MISIAGISAVALVAAVRSASPAGLPVRVMWNAPPGCSDADAFFAAITSRAERVRRAEVGQDGARLEVKLARLGSKVHGELRLVTEDGRSDLRRVDGATCDEVAEALSLTAALALGVSAHDLAPSAGGQGRATPAPSGAPSSPSPPAAAVALPPPPPVTVAPAPAPPPIPADPASGKAPASPGPVSPPSSAMPASPPRRLGRSIASLLAVGLGPAAGQVVTPHLSVGGTAYLGVEDPGPAHLTPSVALALLYLRNDLLGEGGPALFRLAAGSLTACPGWGWHGSLASVEPCASGVGGWLSASDAAVTVRRSVSRSWWSAGAVLRARARLGAGFFAQLDASVTVPLVERRFVTTTPEQTVGTSPRVAPMFSLTLGHRL